jgi:alkylation response protein AidB-like acyl-CoA dehydrogenase
MADGPHREELAAFRELARRFARGSVSPFLSSSEFPFVPFASELADEMHSLGFFDILVPERQGGLGQSLRALHTIVEEIAIVDGSSAFLAFSQAVGRYLVATLCQNTHHTLDVQDRREHRGLIATALLHQPEDAGEGLRARPVPGGYRLDGGIDSLVCLPVASTALVPAVLGDGREDALFLLDLRTAGVHVGEALLGLGLRGCPVADLRVSASIDSGTRLAQPGVVDRYRTAIDGFRLAAASISLGILRGSYQEAFAYAHDRHQGKRPIIHHDMVRELLSGMASWIDVGSAALAHTTQELENGQRLEASQTISVQELVTHAVARATTDGVQVLGGYGYMKDYGQERRMRDAKQLQSIFGSSPIRRMDVMTRRLDAAD